MQKPSTFKTESTGLVLIEKTSLQDLENLRKENVRLKAKIELMEKLVTTQKFYKYYFSKLRDFKTNKQCFDSVNQLYYDLFGIYRFSCYSDFKSKLLKNGK